uniref:HDC06599 n=1 Tax=Drosophila melanogaster TaxID=7227 RepID=Q6IGD1_DROME|nr:TPA_inf: HDC06599 [Drosophila melanogaster]
MGRMRLLAKMVLHAFRRCIAWQDAFLRCAENFIFMASAEGVGICALSAIIQLHTSAKGVKWNGVARMHLLLLLHPSDAHAHADADADALLLMLLMLMRGLSTNIPA